MATSCSSYADTEFIMQQHVKNTSAVHTVEIAHFITTIGSSFRYKQGPLTSGPQWNNRMS